MPLQHHVLYVCSRYGQLCLDKGMIGPLHPARPLGGHSDDLAPAQIDTRASAFAAVVALTAIIVSWLVEVANDRDGSTYVKLGALGGVAYIAAVAWQRSDT